MKISPSLMKASFQRFGCKQKNLRIYCEGFPACSVTPTGFKPVTF